MASGEDEKIVQSTTGRGWRIGMDLTLTKQVDEERQASVRRERWI